MHFKFRTCIFSSTQLDNYRTVICSTFRFSCVLTILKIAQEDISSESACYLVRASLFSIIVRYFIPLIIFLEFHLIFHLYQLPSALQNACNFNRMSVSRFETFMYISFRLYNRYYVSISRVSSISIQNIHLLLIDLKRFSKEYPIKCLRFLTSPHLNDILNPLIRLLVLC
jgi:hypothetical protein